MTDACTPRMKHVTSGLIYLVLTPVYLNQCVGNLLFFVVSERFIENGKTTTTFLVVYTVLVLLYPLVIFINRINPIAMMSPYPLTSRFKTLLFLTIKIAAIFNHRFRGHNRSFTHGGHVTNRWFASTQYSWAQIISTRPSLTVVN